MEDFSEHVGLSRPTVSKYFNDPSSVRKKTRETIEEAIKKSGYRPNMLAVNLNRRRGNIIGIIIPQWLDPFFMALTRRIEAIANEAGFQTFVLSSDGKPEKEEEAIKTFRSMNVAGAIIAPIGRIAGHHEKFGRDIPLVFVDTPLDEESAFVGTDNRQSFGLIVDYLCRSGEPPAYFGMPDVNVNATERRNAYLDTMARLGLKPHIINVSSVATWDFEQFAFEEASRILSSSIAPSIQTIICANDRLAFGVIAAAWRKGLKVGHGPGYDIRVAGHDDHPLSQYACPPITTVAQNYNEIGRLGISLLLRKLGEDVQIDDVRLTHERVLLNAELMLRKSA